MSQLYELKLPEGVEAPDGKILVQLWEKSEPGFVRATHVHATLTPVQPEQAWVPLKEGDVIPEDAVFVFRDGSVSPARTGYAAHVGKPLVIDYFTQALFRPVIAGLPWSEKERLFRAEITNLKEAIREMHSESPARETGRELLLCVHRKPLSQPCQECGNTRQLEGCGNVY